MRLTTARGTLRPARSTAMTARQPFCSLSFSGELRELDHVFFPIRKTSHSVLQGKRAAHKAMLEEFGHVATRLLPVARCSFGGESGAGNCDFLLTCRQVPGCVGEEEEEEEQEEEEEEEEEEEATL
ncbi:hypothetical protein E2C01_087143 [Portunus trituberculatus]|uniref:Uncharacterized protein n=1 Tax=Portunus trituberculatus TaxID=210409 RepID=A0A5B7J2K4_PORTR|nr:hypothetical protein [Portunus trituberculatus]